MFDSHRLMELMIHHGYLIIFALIFLSNMGLPVPDETTVLLAGTLAGKGILTYPWVFSVCLVAAVAGDNAGYWIGYKGGRRILLKYGRMMRITDVRMAKFEHYFLNHGRKTVFFGRFVAGLRLMVGPMSGAARMPFHRFFVCNFFGALIWVALVTQIGYRFGTALSEQMDHAKWWILALTLLGITGVAWHHRSQKE